MSRTGRTTSDWSQDERRNALAGTGIFGGLPPATLQALAASTRARALTAGEYVFLEGQDAGTVNLLVSGRVKVVRQTDDGREVIIRIIHPGEIFGGAAGWGTPTYPLSAIALESVVVLGLAADRFARLIADYPEFALAVIRDLGARLRDAEERIQALQTERVERRIARALLQLAAKTGRVGEQGVEIGLPLSRQDLAELCGTTLSTASRTLSSWDRCGLVVAGRERVIIADLDGLRRIAERSV